ncbi:suppressor of G2 allele of skp1 [Rhodnius prolixus]|uniref:Putative suppressor of g2 allele of skp1 n=2 Tax=Rhodnius TaxID=13248 RepID=R4G8C8_RHOPR
MEENPSGDGASQPQTPLPYKLDWYQTETQVVLTVLAKNVESDKLKITFTNSEISMLLAFKDGTVIDRNIHLENSVVGERCAYKIFPTKIEMRLPKLQGVHWVKLESEEVQISKPVRNWDKVVSEIEDDKLEGEAVLNSLFQKIYAEGSDEVKKAMNKSFLESGGTELNTNWDAVSKGKVSIKPPEGMEWRTWDK